jgi:hypothetical protein
MWSSDFKIDVREKKIATTTTTMTNHRHKFVTNAFAGIIMFGN